MQEIKFGRYPQRKDSCILPIQWLVLYELDNEMLLLSKYALDAVRYDSVPPQRNDWESSAIRKWLNTVFCKEAFDENERNLILKTTVDNSKDTWYDKGYHCKKDCYTHDNIFLLSYIEADTFLHGISREYNSYAQATPTEYALFTGAVSVESHNEICSPWWLRSPGPLGYKAAAVNFDGSYCFDSVQNGRICVRPAMWIRKNIVKTISDEKYFDVLLNV